ncbi:MAG TPA: hypothetical protein VGG20_04110 [Thermoanaerobaculia bacterium]|jgi:hypothetical protein
MSEPVKGEGKQGKLARLNDGLDRYKNVVALMAILFTWAASSLGGFYLGLEAARTAAENRIKSLEDQIDKRVALIEGHVEKRIDSDQFAIKALEDEQVDVRTYLDSAQVEAADAFEIDCIKAKGTYTSNPKVCRYVIEGQVKSVRFQTLAARSPKYGPLTP